MPIVSQRVRALCFDVDGTLSDTDDFYVDRIARRIARIPGIRHPHRLARRLVMWSESPGNAMLALADAIGLDGPMIAAINWGARRHKSRVESPPVIPGVVEMLQSLRGRYPMAVVSARDEFSTESFLRQHNLLAYFSVVVTALSAPRTKPYPDPLRLAARHLGVETEGCLMIGDTTVDVRCGRSAGTQTVGVLCGFGEEAELVRQGADSILSTTADLATLLG